MSTNRLSPPKGYVYFVAPAGQLCAVKIGWSIDPWSTVHEAGNRWTWFGLSVLATVECDRYSALAGTGRASLERAPFSWAAERVIYREILEAG